MTNKFSCLLAWFPVLASACLDLQIAMQWSKSLNPTFLDLIGCQNDKSNTCLMWVLHCDWTRKKFFPFQHSVWFLCCCHCHGAKTHLDHSLNQSAQSVVFWWLTDITISATTEWKTMMLHPWTKHSFEVHPKHTMTTTQWIHNWQTRKWAANDMWDLQNDTMRHISTTAIVVIWSIAQNGCQNHWQHEMPLSLFGCKCFPNTCVTCDTQWPTSDFSRWKGTIGLMLLVKWDSSFTKFGRGHFHCCPLTFFNLRKPFEKRVLLNSHHQAREAALDVRSEKRSNQQRAKPS